MLPVSAALIVLGLVACSNLFQASPVPAELPTAHQTTPTAIPDDASPTLNSNQVASLSSLTIIDEYPLYTMHIYGSYDQRILSFQETRRGPNNGDHQWKARKSWACSLFVTLGDPDNILFGRNFDWEYSPAVLLFTDPPNGYASVSMVDIEFLGFDAEQFITLTDLPLEDRQPLLFAPHLPIDGMNEMGLAIAMAAVPPGQMDPDPNKATIGSLGLMREILDHAGNIDQALEIFNKFNIDFSGGPAIHYLVADLSGRAVLVEFFEGEMQVIPNEYPWHQATNFLVSAVEVPEGKCRRYDKISDVLQSEKGILPAQSGLNLLSDVSQINTQWSILYNMNSGKIDVLIGQQFDQLYTFHLNP